MDYGDGDSWDPASLGEYRPGLTALARRLVRDADVADDLVQSTFVRAIERRPARGEGLAGWLRAVLRNEARQRRRGEARRIAREAHAASVSLRADGGDVAARFESAVLLMNAVRGLEPVHREVILLRFFDELPPRKIAARLGVPVKTIDSRIQRALARLRIELDAGHAGDRRRWLVALAPLSEPGLFASALLSAGSLLGGMTVKAMIGILVVTVGLVAAAIFFGSDGSSRREDTARLTSPARPDPPAVGSREAPDLDASASREVARAEVEPSRTTPVPPAAAPATRCGRLVDLDGMPLAGVALRGVPLDAGGASCRALTDASGAFEFAAPSGAYRPECETDDHTLLAVIEFEIEAAGSLPELRLVGAATRAVAGLVVDERGDPVPGAELDFTFADEVRVRLGDDAAHIRRERRVATSSDHGRFAIAGLPAIEGVVCNASKPGFAGVEIELASVDRGDELRIVLARTDAAPATLEGIAFDPAGAPLPGVRLGFGGRPATSDASGRFRFDYDAASPPEKLLACARGLLPVEIPRPEGGAWPSFVEARFSSPPKAIAGIVLDERGEPLPRARVWIADSTPLAAWDQGIWIAESIVSGASMLRIEAEADDRGRFRIGDLLDREYDVKVLDWKRAWITDAGRVRAGDENLVIRLRGEELIPRLSGRVVDSSRRGVAGASVYVLARMLAATAADGMKYYDTANGPSAETDADGNFTLLEVATRDASLDVTRDGLLDDASFEWSDSPPNPLVLVVAWRCDFRVEVEASRGFTEFELRDERGEALPLFRYEPQSIGQVSRGRIVDGRSETLAASDAARELVLVRKDEAGSETIERKPIRLTPGASNVLR